MKTCKDLILEKLRWCEGGLAIHEFNLTGYSENNIGTRLPELALEGKVIGTYRKGESFKEWRLVRVDKTGQMEMI